MGYQQGSLRGKVVIDIVDDLGSYICFASAWGSHNDCKTGLCARGYCFDLNRGEMNAVQFWRITRIRSTGRGAVCESFDRIFSRLHGLGFVTPTLLRGFGNNRIRSSRSLKDIWGPLRLDFLAMSFNCLGDGLALRQGGLLYDSLLCRENFREGAAN